MPPVRVFNDLASETGFFCKEGGVLHNLHTFLLDPQLLFSLNHAQNCGRHTLLFRIEMLSMHDKVEQRDSLVCVQVDLVSQICWLTQNLSEVFNRLWIAFETHVNHAAIEVVARYLDRVCP